MIFLINSPDQRIIRMNNSEKLDSDYLAMAELHKEISSVVQRSIDEGHQDLTASDIEHVLKMTQDVTIKIKVPTKKLTV